MPVTLEEVDHARWAADAQVATDLSRIYHDAPAERLPQAADDFVREHLQSHGTFCCALFNARLLGAVSVRKTPGVWWLAHVCVRRTTRRRGVGSRLMALVAEAARRENSVLRVEASQLRMEEQLLLTRLGYRPEEEGAYFEFKPLASGGCQ